MFFEDKCDTKRSLQLYTDLADIINVQAKFEADYNMNVVALDLDRGQVMELYRGLGQWLNGDRDE